MNPQHKTIIQWIQHRFNLINQSLNFEEETHQYTIGNQPLKSVSRFIDPWNREFLDKLDETHPAYDARFAKSMPFFSNRGSAIHKLTEAFDKGEDVKWESYIEYGIYYKAFHSKYIASGKWSIIAIEQKLYDMSFELAGTIDRLYIDNETGEIILLDIKTGLTREINYYQQAMYVNMLRKWDIVVDRSYLLSLKDGMTLKEITFDIIDEKIKKIYHYYWELEKNEIHSVN